MSFDTILVANRGEIALRIIRTASKLGYRTVAVFSDADRNAPHVAAADHAVRLGPAESAKSYLSVEKVIAAAKQSGAGAIHPGYGFLSENADFASACAMAGIVFIGPEPLAIRIMGDKVLARRKMLAAGVLCVPGYDGADQSTKALRQEAAKIGYPVMIKAAAGGGGKGMRLVAGEDGFDEALGLARAEADAAFGSNIMLLEKAIVEPRHVELQVFADQNGNVIHLGERDCSVQRRHQKVIEEAPGPAVTPELRARMGATAIEAAKAIGYVGVGTVEFLLDQEGTFYFLEMNTRLQVEHPVTEMVTGVDLVAWQISVAQGQPLPMQQDELGINGWAIEARLYAENPANDFLPTGGRVLRLDMPKGDGVRLDIGIAEGDDISTFYDPMLAKVIAHGATRDEARLRLIGALQNMCLVGIVTNQRFLTEALSHDTFSAGNATTGFVDHYFASKSLEESKPEKNLIAAATAVLFASVAVPTSSRLSLPAHYLFEVQGERCAVRVTRERRGLCVNVAGQDIWFDHVEFDGRMWQFERNGHLSTGPAVVLSNGEIWLSHMGEVLHLRDILTLGGSSSGAGGSGQIHAPMHGRIVELRATPGEAIKKGQAILVMEAMKMQHTLRAECDGILAETFVRVGGQVEAGQLLAEIEKEDQS